MKIITYTLLLFIALLASGCEEKKQTTDIIVPAPEKEVTKKDTLQMSETNQKHEVEWLGSTYKINIVRSADKSLPKVYDESGNTYYDNTITLQITRNDGTELLNKTFHKSNFADIASNSKITKKGALLGIVFDKIENNKLVFATSIGSPDISSDEYVPFIMTIDRDCHISTSLDTRMDSDVSDQEEDDGV